MRVKRVITILNDLGRVELDHGPQHGDEYEHVTNEVCDIIILRKI